MLYEYHLAVPPNTPYTAPLTQAVPLVPGRIIAIAVQFPYRCAGLVHAQIWEGLYVRWPSNPDSDLYGDNVVVEWREEYDLDPTAPRLRLVAWNLDDTYVHTVTFRFNILPKAVIDAQGRALAALDYLGRWFDQRQAT